MSATALSPARSIRVIADDLTGAAECAALLASASRPSSVALSDVDDRDDVYDLDQRNLYRGVPATVKQWLGRADVPYLKTDSLLRGPWVDLLRELRGLGAPVVFCPARPREGRFVQSGRALLSDAERLRLGEVRLEVDLVEELMKAGLSAARWHRGQFLLPVLQRADVVVVDADSNEDIRVAAEEALAARDSSHVAMAGAQPFLDAINRKLCRSQPALTDAGLRSHVVQPFLCLVGSTSIVAKQQLERFCDHFGLPLETEQGTGEPSRNGTCQPWAGGVLFRPDGRRPHAVELAAMCQLWAQSARRAGTLLATGGDTARAILNAMQVGKLQVLGQTDGGVSVTHLEMPGRAPLTFLLKPGSIGGDTLIVDAFTQTESHA